MTHTTSSRLEFFSRLLRERGLAPRSADTIERPAADAPKPLSTEQLRFWFVEQVSTNKSVNNDGYVIRMRGPLDQDALEKSIARIIDRHRALRTVFPIVSGEPVHVIRPAAETSDLAVVDVSPDPDLSSVHAFAARETIGVFDLECGPW